MNVHEIRKHTPLWLIEDVHNPDSELLRICAPDRAGSGSRVGILRVLIADWRSIPALRNHRPTKGLRLNAKWIRRDGYRRDMIEGLKADVRVARRLVSNRVEPRFAEKLAMGETNDCVVLALATITGSRYSDAHAACELVARRKPGSGTSTGCLLGYGGPSSGKAPRSLLGSTFRPIEVESTRTVKTFLRKHPVGWFIVTIDHHAFAIVDGVAIDPCTTRALSRIKFAWSVQPTTENDGSTHVI